MCKMWCKISQIVLVVLLVVVCTGCTRVDKAVISEDGTLYTKTCIDGIEYLQGRYVLIPHLTADSTDRPLVVRCTGEE